MIDNAKILLGYFGLLAFFGVTGFVFGAVQNPDAHPIPTEDQTAAVSDAIVFPDVSVVAQAAYVFDATTGDVLFDKNAQAQLPLASLTKVPVILLAHEYLDEDDTVTISAQALSPEGSWGFVPGEAWRARDLIDFTLMTSSNDGAAALAEAVEQKTHTNIVELLNNKARELGLSQTYFLNETGLDASTALSGAYGSAKDVAKLFTYAYNTAPELYNATTQAEYTFTNLAGKEYKAENTNKVVEDIPGVVLSKTGFTDLAGGNLGIVIEPEPGHQISFVVLGSTVDNRFSDMLTLTQAALREPGEAK